MNSIQSKTFGIFSKESNFILDYQEKKKNPLFFRYIGSISEENRKYNLFCSKEEFSFIRKISELKKIEDQMFTPQPFFGAQREFSAEDLQERKNRISALEKIPQKTRELLKTCFPATEPDDLILVDLFFPLESRLLSHRFSLPLPLSQEIPQKLGYGAELDLEHGNLLIAIPSPQTIQSNMQKIFDEQSIDYSVKVLEDPNISSDREFIQAYLTHDVVASIGKEELHDHFLHILPLAMIMKENPQGYIFQKKRIQELILQRIEKIEKTIQEKKISKEDEEVLWLSLSATIDIILNFRDLKSLQNVDEAYLKRNSLNIFTVYETYLPYLEKRFPGKVLLPGETEKEASERAQNLYEGILSKHDLVDF